MVFFLLFLPVHYLSPRVLRAEAAEAERSLIEMLAATFVFSWTGVVRYHGPRPSRRPQQVFVANHTSMIDFIVLEQSTPFAVIMQKHGGWVGWMQSVVLASLGCIHFNRGEAADRANVAARIKRHVHDPHANPLLIFPEGTCVNNEYCVMFKKGAFELGVTVCPIAIKARRRAHKHSLAHHTPFSYLTRLAWFCLRFTHISTTRFSWMRFGTRGAKGSRPTLRG